jgi:hypothetical protein
LRENKEEEGFTPAVSRRKRKEKKYACKILLGGTLAKSVVASGGAHTKSSVTSVKDLNEDPLCGIMAGARRRKVNPKYL